MVVDIFINFIPEFRIFFTITSSTEVIRIHEFMSFALRCFVFNSFVNIDKLCDQTVVLPVILRFQSNHLFSL